MSKNKNKYKPGGPGQPDVRVEDSGALPAGQKIVFNEARSVDPQPRDAETPEAEEPPAVNKTEAIEPPLNSFRYIVKGSPGRKVPIGHRFFYDNNGKKTEAETLNEGFFNNVGEFRAICRNTNNVTW